mgnify:CR=1 FL=1
MSSISRFFQDFKARTNPGLAGRYLSEIRNGGFFNYTVNTYPAPRVQLGENSTEGGCTVSLKFIVNRTLRAFVYVQSLWVT